jgi:DNA-binding NarL/FixJ family response regulator
MSQQKNNPKLRRVAIVEDDRGLRDRLESILESAPGVCCVGTYGSAEKALAGMVAVQPDVILMDINLPGRHSHRPSGLADDGKCPGDPGGRLRPVR